MTVPAKILPEGSKVIDETSGNASLALPGLESLVMYLKKMYPKKGTS